MKRSKRKLTFENLESRRLLTTYVVDTLIDGPLNETAGDGFLSLREALEAASTNSSVDGAPAGDVGITDYFQGPDDVITFKPGLSGEITLTAGELLIADAVQISGPGSKFLSINANESSRIFRIQIENFRHRITYIASLALTGGRASGAEPHGGALLTNATTTVTQVWAYGSRADGNGGALSVDVIGGLFVKDSTFSNNQAGGEGGAIWDDSLNIKGSTLVGNSATVGGAIYTAGAGRADFQQNTVVGNVASESAAGIFSGQTNGRIDGSVVVGNFLADGEPADLDGRFNPDSEFNVIGRDNSRHLSRHINIHFADWQDVVANDGVAPILADNGGLIRTVALLGGGPAVDAGDPSKDPDRSAANGTTDQRGERFRRIVDGDNDGVRIIDAGAFEYNAELVRVRLAALEAYESSSVMPWEISVDRELNPGQVVSVNFQLLNAGTATPGSDFVGLEKRTVTFVSGGELSQTIQVELLEDSLVEDDETIIASLSNISQGALVDFEADAAIGQIIDNEAASFRIDKEEITVDEAGTLQDSITVTLEAEPASDVTVVTTNIATIIVPDPTYVVFTPENWNIPQTFTYTGVNDYIDVEREADVYVAIWDGPGAYKELEPLIAKAKILDDDEKGIFVNQISSVTGEDGTTAKFEIRLGEAVFQGVTIPVTVSDPTEGSTDVTSVTLRHPDEVAVVTVTGIDDAETDGPIEYSVRLGPSESECGFESCRYDGLEIPDLEFVNLDDELPFYDFGDAPNAAQSGLQSGYPTLLEDDGARHAAGDLFLGASIDAEHNAAPSLASDGDDIADDSDEDGVRFLSSVVSAPDSDTTASLLVSSSGIGRLDAWIDFNRDGDWSDAGEQILVGSDVAAGDNVFSFDVPAEAAAGSTFARFRLSTAGGLAPTGAADDGEVEDYQIDMISTHGDQAAWVEIAAAAPMELNLDGSDITATLNGRELLRVPHGAMQINVRGSEAADELHVMHGDLKPGEDYAFTAAGGVDSVVVRSAGHEVTLGEHFAGLENIDLTGAGENSLRLTHQAIQGNHSPFSLSHDNDDTVDYGDGWQIAQPEIDEGVFTHRLSQEGTFLHVQNARPFQNPLWRIDVNASGQVAPNDVLVVINQLNRGGAGQLDPPSSLPDRHLYTDVNGDNVLSPIDALIIINFVNSQANAEAESGSGWPVVWPGLQLDYVQDFSDDKDSMLSTGGLGKTTPLFEIPLLEERPTVAHYWPRSVSAFPGAAELEDFEDDEWLALLEDLAASRLKPA